MLDNALLHKNVITVSDLCEWAARCDPRLREFAQQEAPKVYACQPRAVRALFARAGAPLPSGAEIVNIGATQHNARRAPPSQYDWPPWFPVIDKERCINCRQCLEFCLFGVYEEDESGQVRVTNPANCKNNCPACARICPQTAIIFPKCGESPINGAEIDDEEVARANIKLNVDKMLGDDIYGTLNARKQKRRRLLDKKKVEQALSERQRWETTSE